MNNILLKSIAVFIVVLFFNTAIVTTIALENENGNIAQKITDKSSNNIIDQSSRIKTSNQQNDPSEEDPSDSIRVTQTIEFDETDFNLKHEKGYDFVTLENGDITYNPGELIVKFTEDAPARTLIISERGFVNTSIPSFDILNEKYEVRSMERVFKNTKSSEDVHGLSRFYTLTFSEDNDVFLAAENYKKNRYVECADPNYIPTIYSTPDDPYYSSCGSWGQDHNDLYGLHVINAADAWNLTAGNDVVIAVVDTGVDYTHPDLAANMWINEDEIPGNGIDDDGDDFVDNIYGADFGNNDGDPMDYNGHGTHCAGTIAAGGNNAIGIVGVSWQAKIMAVKKFSDGGSSDGESETRIGSDRSANAIKWAADNGADVISCSWGFYTRTSSDPVLEDAIRYAYDTGCVILFAAGNSDDDVKYRSPQNMDEIITVAATDYQDKKAWRSNWGEKVSVSAPGFGILSLRAKDTDLFPDDRHIIDREYYRLSGTSMACPHVAGLAALMISLDPSLSNKEVAERIISTADNIDVLNPGYEGLLGSGRINAFEAVHVYKQNVGVRSIDKLTKHVKSGELIYVNATITNSGRNNQTDVLVKFLVNGLEIDTATISFLESYTAQDVSFAWTPSFGPGQYTLTINVKIPDGYEEFYGDNIKTEAITVGVHNINSDQCFETIQQAIDDPETLNGHSIIVPCGIYNEHIIINKSISLMGYNRNTTIIEGYQPGRAVVHVSSNDVYVSGFTIRNGTFGVYIESSSNVDLSDINIFDNDEVGVYVESSNYVVISNCDIFNNIGYENGYGVYVKSSNHVYINYNEIYNNGLGIFVTDFSWGIKIFSNVIHDNSLRNPSVNPINVNDALPKHDIIKCRSIPMSKISNQPTIKYFAGILLENVTISSVVANNIFDNTEGIRITDGSTDNHIYHNNFDNIQNAFDNGSNNQWNDDYFDERYDYRPYGGNWWSDYNSIDDFHGPDQDKSGSDGICDEPHTIPGVDSRDHYPLMNPWAGHIPITMHVDGSVPFTGYGTPENPYKYINDAMHNDADGDTIFVHIGTYDEYVVIDKSINFVGENRASTVLTSDHVSGIVVKIIADFVTLTGFTVKDGPDGFSENGAIKIISDNNIISGNTIRNNNMDGIHLKSSSNNTLINNLITNNNGRGLYAKFSTGNIILNNNFINNHNGGICLVNSYYATINENNFAFNGITIVGDLISWWNTHTIENNVANRKPIRYYKNTNDIVVPSNTAQIILANCSNFTIQNFNIEDIDTVIQLGFSSNNNIIENTISNSIIGVHLSNSNNNKIFRNIITNNQLGINIEHTSYKNNIYKNIMTYNQYLGIELSYDSSYNKIIENNITNNNYGGIRLSDFCRNNNFIENTVTNSNLSFKLTYSDKNNIVRSIISNNSNYGIYLSASFKNTISENMIANNVYSMYITDDGLDCPSDDNCIYHNNFINFTQDAYDKCSNIWDHGYPLGGNYWDVFHNESQGAYDEYHGPDQNLFGGDGIVDSPYDISGKNPPNQDRYPLITPWVEDIVGPTVVGDWKSWKTHGIVGSLYIPISPNPFNNDIAVETRYGGITKLTIDFSEPIKKPDSIDIRVVGCATNIIPVDFVNLQNNDTRLVVFFSDFTGPDRYTITLENITDKVGNPLIGDNDAVVIVQYGNVYNKGVSQGFTDGIDAEMILSYIDEQVTLKNCKYDIFGPFNQMCLGLSEGRIDMIDFRQCLRNPSGPIC